MAKRKRPEKLSATIGMISTMQPTQNVSYNPTYGYVTDGRAFTAADARDIRKDPTVRLARLLSVAPILAAAWSVEHDKDADPRAIDFVDKFRKFRSHLIKEAAFGMLDYGWRGMEVVWELDDQGYYAIEDFVSLLPEITYAMPSEDGRFLGFYQSYTDDKSENRVNRITGKAKALLFNQRQEGINFYGESDLEIIQKTKERYDFAANIAEAYDTKSAGAVWVVFYPIGHTILNSVRTENSIIARDLLATIRSNGSIAVPMVQQGAIGDLLAGSTSSSLATSNGWMIKLMESTGTSSSHLLSRMQHLETLMVRGIGLPERSLLEGKHGTKADAQVHADVALTSAIDRSDYIIGTINEGPVDAGLVLNFGPKQKGKVRLIAEPIGEDEKLFLREVYLKILGGADSALLDLENVDMDSVREVCGVPSMFMDKAVDKDKSNIGKGNSDGKEPIGDPLNDLRKELDNVDGE